MENKDTALKIMLDLDDRELFILCGREKSLEFKNKRFSRFCNDKFFWEKRFTNRFGNLAASYKPKDRSWKMHYLTVVTHLDEYKDDPWKFFDLIKWETYRKPETAGFYVESSADKADIQTDEGYFKLFKVNDVKESLHNSFWMLELGKDIIIEYPIYTYSDDVNYIQRRYTSDTNYTPGKVLKLIYDFYQEPADYDDPYDNDMSEEDDMRRIDFMHAYTTLEGFTDNNGIKNLSLGS